MQYLRSSKRALWALFGLVLVIRGGLQLYAHAQAAALAVDVQVLKHQTSGTTITSPSFSTAQSGELLIAFVSADGPSTTNGESVTGVSGGSLAWSLRQRTNTQYGDSEIWEARATNQLSNVTVQATLNSSNGASLEVTSFMGADLTTDGAVGAANSSTGAPSVSLTTTRAGSWIWGAGNDWDNATSRTVGANQTKVDEYLPASGDTMWIQRQTNTTAAAGTAVNLNDTAPTNDRWNFAAIEILPAGSAAAAPTVSISTPAGGGTVSGTTTISATAAAPSGTTLAGVQFKVDGTNMGSEVTTSPYTTSWTTTTVANGMHTITAVARDSAGDATTSSAVTVTVSNGASTTPLTIDGATHYQTINGLGASINVHSWNNGALKPVIDELIDQNGTKTFRVVMEMTDWEATNDNNDSSTFNWDYYNPTYSGATSYDTAENGSNFGDLWNTIDYLHQRGIPDSQIILSFMGDGPAWNGGTSVNASQEDEWVEEVLSAAYYGYSHGHTFGVFSPNNEEDLGHHEGIAMSASVYADAMNKLAGRMDTLGMSSVRLLGPETSDTLSSYVNAMKAYPALMAKVDHFDFHNYSGSTDNASSIISGSGKDFWMSEFSIYNQAYNLLDQGTSGLMMWDAYDSVYNHAILNGHPSTPGNDAGNAPSMIAYDASTQTYTPRKSFYEYAQLFKYTPLGSVRIAGSQSKGEAYAFQDPVSHRITIVGENDTASPVTYAGVLNNVSSTPSLQSFTTNLNDNTANMTPGSDVALTNNTFTYTVAANTIFTLTYAPPVVADTTPPTAPANLAAQGSLGKAALTWTASTDDIGVTGYNIYRSTTSGFTPSTANKIGTSTTTSYADTIANGTYYYLVTAYDAVGNTSANSNQAGITVLTDNTSPTVPTNLNATAQSSSLVNLSWTASTDDIGVTGYKVLRGGMQIGTSTTTNYSDTTVSASTAYAYTVQAYDASSNVSAASNTANVTTPAAPVSTLSLDTTASTHQTSSAKTIVSPALTTTKTNELLVAFIESDGGSSAESFSGVTGGGLTWTLRQRSNTQKGTAEIWQAVAASLATNMTVTATRANGSYTGSITVAAFIGASTTTNGATIAANAASGAPSATLTTTKAGSWVWGVGNDWDGAAARTVGTNQTKVDEYVASGTGDTFWVQRQTAVTPNSGTAVTLNDTAPTADRWNLAAIEILPQ